MRMRTKYVVLALLILIPSFINLSVPIYNREFPEFLGLPFFYWFQTVWLFVSAGFYLAFTHVMEKEQ